MKVIKRTYSRRSQTPATRGENAPVKRRRIESGSLPTNTTPALSTPEGAWTKGHGSSSPHYPSNIVSSNGSIPDSTPPSSPPPSQAKPLKRKETVQAQLSFKNHTSILASRSLEELCCNSQSKPNSKKPLKLTQMTLDLGQRTQRRCPTCGMEYTSSSSEDNALHKKFHAQSIGGIELGRKFVDGLSKERAWEGNSGEMIVVISKSDSANKKRVVEGVLDVVEKELGGVGIEKDRLWSELQNQKFYRYKAFLYIRGYRCIGVCLAERIEEAYEVLQDTAQSGRERGSESSSITIGIEVKPATMGISRIWASNSARRAGVATRLLDCAADSFLYGLKISKGKIAFSQPTESGGNLARRWFGKESGWLVYVD